MSVEGDRVGEDGKKLSEDLELWRRDPLECIQELIGNPAFASEIAYEPERVYTDAAGENRMFDEAWTADWWWETQVRRLLISHVQVLTYVVQGKLPEGAVVAPVILASDKTQLTRFRGDKQAWPVYLSLGNISKEKRRQVRHKVRFSSYEINSCIRYHQMQQFSSATYQYRSLTAVQTIRVRL